mmetsp:Transcript_17882/g.31127  ORF Transcript_17882/g.31127 Transcript_17882/m.31127 type:complete len:227 (-) Transcript_17882:95-775(-)
MELQLLALIVVEILFPFHHQRLHHLAQGTHPSKKLQLCRKRPVAHHPVNASSGLVVGRIQDKRGISLFACCQPWSGSIELHVSIGRRERDFQISLALQFAFLGVQVSNRDIWHVQLHVLVHRLRIARSKSNFWGRVGFEQITMCHVSDVLGKQFIIAIIAIWSSIVAHFFASRKRHVTQAHVVARAHVAVHGVLWCTVFTLISRGRIVVAGFCSIRDSDIAICVGI